MLELSSGIVDREFMTDIRSGCKRLQSTSMRGGREDGSLDFMVARRNEGVLVDGGKWREDAVWNADVETREADRVATKRGRAKWRWR